MSDSVYKICAASDWESAVRAGVYRGSPDDVRDGFIHFSLAHQVVETARKYFAHRADLVLVEIPASCLGDQLRFEVSRGGRSLSPSLRRSRARLGYPGFSAPLERRIPRLFGPSLGHSAKARPPGRW